MTPYDVQEIYIEMELELLQSFRRNMAQHQAEELKEGFEWPQWQARKLEAMRRYQARNSDILDGYMPKVRKATANILREAYGTGAGNVDGFLRRFPGLSRQVDENSFFGVNDRKLNTLIETAQNDLEDARYAILRKMDDEYRQTLYKAQMFADTGASTVNSAVDMATRDFLAKGINCIEYRDGRRVNIASYAQMYLRTASKRATAVAEGARRAEWGVHTVQITRKGTTCELCLPWQGKVLIDDVYSGGSSADGDYPLLSAAMAAGLFHPNCQHKSLTYYEGISSAPTEMTDAEKEKALQNYEQQQKQRQIEYSIRKYKRLEAGSVDEDNRAQHAAKVQERQAVLREHLRNNPQLRREPEREKIKPGGNAYAETQREPDGGTLHSMDLRPIKITDEAIAKVPRAETSLLTPAGNARLQERHRDLLRYVQDDPPGTEAIAYYDLQMRELARRKGKPGENKVAGIKVDVPHLVMHNHPSGTTFTHDDVLNFVNHPTQKILTAISNNGNVYIIEKMSSYNPKGFLKYIDKKSDEYGYIFESPEKYMTFVDDILKGTGRYGLRYTAKRPE